MIGSDAGRFLGHARRPAAGRMGAGDDALGRVHPTHRGPAGRRRPDPARRLGRAAPARRARPLPARARPAARRARPGARGQPRSRRGPLGAQRHGGAREHLGARVGVPVVLPRAHPAPLDGGRRGLPAPGLPGPAGCAPWSTGSARSTARSTTCSSRSTPPWSTWSGRPGRPDRRSRTPSTRSPRRCSRTSPTRSASSSARSAGTGSTPASSSGRPVRAQLMPGADHLARRPRAPTGRRRAPARSAAAASTASSPGPSAVPLTWPAPRRRGRSVGDLDVGLVVEVTPSSGSVPVNRARVTSQLSPVSVVRTRMVRLSSSVLVPQGGSPPYITLSTSSTPSAAQRRVHRGAVARGELGVQAVHQRLVGLPAADEAHGLLVRTRSRPASTGRCPRAPGPGPLLAVPVERRQRGPGRRPVVVAGSSLSASAASVTPRRTTSPQNHCTPARCQSRSSASQSGQVGTRASGGARVSASANRADSRRRWSR